MSYCWSYWTTTYSEKVAGHGGVQDYWQGDGNDYERGTIKGNCNLETGPLWCSYVWIAPVASQRQKWGWGCWKGGYSLCSPNPTAPKEFCLGMMSRDTSIPHRRSPSLCLGPLHIHRQDRHLRALYVGPCAGWASTRLPIACLCCINCHIWIVTPQFLLGANLFEEPKCPPH